MKAKPTALALVAAVAFDLVLGLALASGGAHAVAFASSSASPHGAQHARPRANGTALQFDKPEAAAAMNASASDAAEAGVEEAGAEAGEGARAARTFGGPRKRLLLLLPIVYKLGVITTLLGVLIALAVKSVAIGLLLLALGAANLAAVTKLKASDHGWSGGGGGHSGGVPIHLHVHGGSVSGGGGGGGGGGGYHHQAYAAWEPAPSAPHPHYTEHYSPSGPHYSRR
ncbi:hypothetical protein R5R35_002480 [Gryllus longicercus]|uniref:Uncharacterized protein n=1 Tax=Gryllus longicercus TaxID=2509291 RepID=A0AAN9Z6M0_9ORTH